MLLKDKNNTALIIAWLCFCVAGYIGILHHEIWLDEAYYYLFSSQNDITALLRVSPDGHPFLWKLVLSLVLKVHHSIFAMQLFHLAIACALAFLVLFKSPFSFMQKISICFGYYFLYEYTLISKNYILGFLLVFSALILFLSKPQRLLPVAILLGLAADCHFFTCIVALCLFIYMLSERRPYLSLKAMMLPVAAFFVCMLVSLYQMLPPADSLANFLHAEAAFYFSFPRIYRFLCLAGKGMVNVPDFRLESYWNSSIFESFSWSICLLVSAAAWLFSFMLLRQNKKILCLFAAAVLAVSCAIYIMPLQTGIRYWGYAYVMLIMCLWLKYAKAPAETSLNKIIINALLLIQVAVGITAYAIDYKRPFSNAENAAALLSENAQLKYPLFVQSLGPGPSLSAYSDKPVYYPASKTFETFSFWIRNKTYTAPGFVAESLSDLKQMKLDTCVLVMTSPLSDSVMKSFTHVANLSEIGHFKGAVIMSENYYLYLLSNKIQP